MELTTVLLVVAGSVVLALQGRSLLAEAPRSAWFRALGWATLLGAGWLLLAALLFVRGSLMLSPGLGVAFAEGSPGRAGLITLLLCTSLVGALAMSSALLARGRSGRVHVTLALALAIGIAAAMRTLHLDPLAPASLAVFSYDLWWPPLLLWMAIALMEGALKACRVDRLETRVYMDASLVATLALWATSRHDAGYRYGDPSSLPLWTAIFWLSIPIFVCAACYVARDLLFRAEISRPRRVVRFVTPILVTLVLLVTGVAWSRLFLVGALIVVTVALLAIEVVRRWRTNTLHLPNLGGPGRLDDGPILLSFAAVIYCLLDLFYFTRLAPLTDLIGLIVATVLLLELLAGSPLRWVSPDMPAGDGRAGSPFVRGLRMIQPRVAAGAGAVRRAASSLVAVDSWPRVTAKLIVGIIVVIVVSEIPRASNTVVYPFLVPPGDAKEYHGKMIAERLLNNLGVLKQELNPYVFTVADTKGGRDGQRFAVGADTGQGPQAALGTATSDFSVGGVKIPLEAVAAAVGRPVRAVLGITEISGVYQKEGERQVLFATSNDGRSWRVTGDAKDGRSEAELIDQMAFEILVQSPGMETLGLTQSWPAFEKFKQGREQWQRYEGGDADALTEAIASFRAAMQADATFVLSQYWLGLALRADGQPSHAIEAFRAALRTRSDYAPAYIALADTLYPSGGYVPVPSSIGAREAEDASQDAYRREAVTRWYQVLQLPRAVLSTRNRALAYTGLCRQAIDDQRYDLAYFRCAQADSQLAHLSGPLHDAPDVRSTRAVALNNMGVALQRTSMQARDPRPDEWSCSEGQGFRTPYATAARRYFERAVAANPVESLIRCNAAFNADAAGDLTVMERLSHEAAAHAAVGDLLSERAESALMVVYAATGKEQQEARARATAYFRRALQEYGAALERDPRDVFTLNSFAYTVWRWHLHVLAEGLAEAPDALVTRTAEGHARRAASLATRTISRGQELAIRDTLGEILLAQNRVDEALEEFQKIETLLPKHPSFDEIRWDIAHAYRCAAQADRTKAKTLLAKSAQFVKQIETNEQDREQLTFYGPHIADENATVCGGSPGPVVARPRYTLAKRRYEPHAACTWVGVKAFADDEEDTRLLAVHVWGGGTERRIGVNRPWDYAWLGREPRDTSRYYFAQLELRKEGQSLTDDAPGIPISEVQPFQTFKGCGRNMISLVFEKTRSEP